MSRSYAVEVAKRELVAIMGQRVPWAGLVHGQLAPGRRQSPPLPRPNNFNCVPPTSLKSNSFLPPLLWVWHTGTGIPATRP